MRPAATALAVGVALGAIGGYGLRIATEDGNGLAVNGGEIQHVVYEAVPGAGGPPPTCVPKTESGVGSWDCSVEIGGSPMSVAIDVSEEGELDGRTERGGHFSSCCIEIRE